MESKVWGVEKSSRDFLFCFCAVFTFWWKHDAYMFHHWPPTYTSLAFSHWKMFIMRKSYRYIHVFHGPHLCAFFISTSTAFLIICLIFFQSQRVFQQSMSLLTSLGTFLKHQHLRRVEGCHIRAGGGGEGYVWVSCCGDSIRMQDFAGCKALKC